MASAGGSRFLALAQASARLGLNIPRENATVLPARRENIRPPIRKVTGP